MFDLTEDQTRRATAWIIKQDREYPAETGAIGGRYTYEFTPTSIGVVVGIRDTITNATLNLTDYGSW